MYTKGPWEVAIVEGPLGVDWIGVVEKGKEYPRMDKVHVLCGPASGKYEEESISDAMLIAAAPELLEALQDYMDQIGQGYEARGLPFGTSQKEADAKARAAIAKATGK